LKGEILSDEDLDDLLSPSKYLDNSDFGRREPRFDGYNFNTEEMAEFYTKAEEQGVTINPMEEAVKQRLINEGALAKKDGAYEALKKEAVISHPQLYDAYSENLIRRHERGHALFETDADYRKGIQDIWESLDTETKELITKFLRFIGYHESVTLTEFAEYFENPELLMQKLKSLNSTAFVYSPGSVISADKKRAAAEVAHEMLEHRQNDAPGKYLKDEFRKKIEAIIPELQKQKNIALKKAGLGTVDQLETVDLSGPLVRDQGIGIASTYVYVKTTVFEGGLESLTQKVAEFEDEKDMVKEEGLKVLEAFIESGGYSSEDTFKLSWSNGEWDIEFLRPAGEKSLQEAMEGEFESIGYDKNYNVNAYLEAMQRVVQQKAWGLNENFELTKMVNAGGELFTFTMNMSPSWTSVSSGDEKVRETTEWRVSLSLNKENRGPYWKGRVMGFDRQEDVKTAFTEAVDELRVLARRNAVDLTSKNMLRDYDIEAALKDIRKYVANPDDDYHLEIVKQIEFNGESVDLRLIQKKNSSIFSDGYETRLGIELPEQDGSESRIIGRMGIVIPDSENRLKGLEEAEKQLKEAIKKYNSKRNAKDSDKDNAMFGVEQSRELGGIDLNPTLLNLKEQGDSLEINLPTIDINLENMTIDGVVPVIQSITPIYNMQFLLGEAIPGRSPNFDVVKK